MKKIKKYDYPLVSIVIPTRNSGTFLENGLQNLKRQTYTNIEIIVIDNNSIDKTVDLAMKYTDHVYKRGPERTAQLNYGIHKAHGKYIYYTGCGEIPDKKLIEEAVNKCEDENFDAIYINVLTKLKKPNIWQKVRALERECYYKEPGMSAARFFKKKVFLELGGYDEKLGGISDDLEFQHRLDINGYKTSFIDSKEISLEEYKSLRTIMSKSIYYGWLIKRYMDKHPQKTKKQYRLVRKEFIKNNKILLEDKLLLMVFIFYKLIQYAFGGIGVFLAKITNDNKRIEKWLFKLNYG